MRPNTCARVSACVAVRYVRIMKIVRLGIGVFIAFASISFLSMAAATDLDQDYNPRGWIQKFGAWWDPIGFWSAQPAAIQKEVERRVKTYKFI